MRTCSRCRIEKTLDGFRGNRTLCKACTNIARAAWKAAHPEKVKASCKRHYEKHRAAFVNRARQRLYGLSNEEFDRMLEEQQGLCKSCKKPLTSGKNGAAIDHCHKTQKVRGLVCSPCNKMIGFAKDDPAVLELGAAYLRATSQPASEKSTS